MEADLRPGRAQAAGHRDAEMRGEGGPGVGSESGQALGTGGSVWLMDRSCVQRAGGHLQGQCGCSQTAHQTCRLQMGSCLGRSLPPSNTKAFLPLGPQVRDSGSTSIYFILFDELFI